MYKKNMAEAVERNTKFLKRQMQDRILFKACVPDNPYLIEENRSRDWITRPALSVSDKEWVIDNCRRKAMIYQNIDDDTIPKEYPTVHFGESVYSYLLGGDVQFVGSEYHTCSGAKPLVCTEEDLDNLKGYDSNYNDNTKTFINSAEYFAKEANGDFMIRYFIAADALNLAVELLGTTEAYFMVGDKDHHSLLCKIMEFGIDYVYWFYKLQKEIYRDCNSAALFDDDFYDLYDKPFYSVDAYTICDSDTYVGMGFEYQQELIRKIGGGLMHMHGTGLLRLLPHIAKLQGLTIIQCGRDLYSSEYLGFENIQEFRKLAGEVPLSISISEDEFITGIKNKTLPGNVKYTCWVKDIDTANRFADMAKEYKI